MVVIVVMMVMWTCHVDVVHTRILQARMRFTKIIVLFVSKVVELVDNIELNCWRNRKEKERPLLSPLATES